MESTAIVVLCTAPSEEVAERLARALLEARCVACVSLVPGLRSLYRWKGAVEEAREVQLLIKTRSERFADVERVLRAEHPYEVPELIALPIVAASADYLAWLVAETA